MFIYLSINYIFFDYTVDEMENLVIGLADGSLNADDVLFTASIKNLDLYCDGVTEEQAIKKLEEKYNKNLSYKLLDNIMNDYPITIGTKSP